MIRNLVIDNYRGFEHFELQELGRVNLLVGMNNSGKTSVLEAIHLLANVGEPSTIRGILARRGDRISGIDEDLTTDDAEVPGARRVFHGHKMTSECIARIRSENEKNTAELKIKPVRVHDLRESHRFDRRRFPESNLLDRSTALGLEWTRSDSETAVGEVEFGVDESARYSKDRRFAIPVIFVSPASLSTSICGRLFDEIALTDEELFVVQSLRIIEPKVSRIAVIKLAPTDPSRRTGRSADLDVQFFMKLNESPGRIPIDCMGDGMQRLLGLSLAMVHVKGGILLVDEIDTGLHYGVMEKMWEMVSETANRLDIQVFATTHSRDCVESLAAVCREDVTQGSQVTIQRIERDTARSIAYTEQQIVAVAERGLEVR